MLEIGAILNLVIAGFLYLGVTRTLIENKRVLRKIKASNEARVKLTLAQQRWRR